MKLKRSTIIAATSSLIMLTVLFIFAVLGDFFLMRSLSANKSEATKIMDHRYQTQDRAMMAQAKSEGYERRMLLPLLVDEYPKLAEFGQEKTLPLGLEANANLYICNEGNGPLKITTDRFGYRNDDQVWNDDSADLVMFGDSFAFGTCQQLEDTIAGSLGETYDLRNVSFPGALPVHYAAMIKTFAPQIKADKAVLIFYSNDNEEISEAATYHDWFFGEEADTSRYFEDDQKLVPSVHHAEFFELAKNEVKRGVEENSNSAKGQSKFSKRVAKLLSHVSLPASRQVISSILSEPGELPDAVKLAVDTLADHCNSAGCRPLIVYIPNSQFWEPDPHSPQFSSDLVDYVESKGLPSLDMTEKLEAFGRAGYADSGIHLSPQGYELVADMIDAHFSSDDKSKN